MTPLERQFQELKASCHAATCEAHPLGTVITVPDVKLEPAGAWNKPSTTVRFVAPVGFPQAQPDCFWVDEDVRLASGGMPMNAAPQAQLGQVLLWFSWHLQRWNPNKDSLKTYLRVIEDRLHRPT